MLMLSLALVLVGRADQGFSEQLRARLDDVLAPLYHAAAAPILAAENGTGMIGQFFQLRAENAQLEAENATLRQWQAVAMSLAAENDALKGSLHYQPPPAPRFYAGEVVADLGGAYTRSVLVALGGAAVKPAEIMGAVAMDGRGVAGRVVDAGGRAARILLITDLNSRIPVALGTKGAPALMAGTNGVDPALMYWSPGQPPQEGDVVLTSAAGGAFPPGLPIGMVHYNGQNDPVVLPLADLSALRVLRLYSYPDVAPALAPVPRAAEGRPGKPDRRH